MSNFAQFMRENKIPKENAKYVATKSLGGENGVSPEWVIKPITTKTNEMLRDECTKDIPIIGKPNMFRQKLNVSEYMAKLIAASVVEPNLNSKELQDSYGVMTPSELVVAMVDDPTEYGEFAQFVQTFNGLDKTLQDKIDEAKN